MKKRLTSWYDCFFACSINLLLTLYLFMTFIYILFICYSVLKQESNNGRRRPWAIPCVFRSATTKYDFKVQFFLIFQIYSTITCLWAALNIHIEYVVWIRNLILEYNSWFSTWLTTYNVDSKSCDFWCNYPGFINFFLNRRYSMYWV